MGILTRELWTLYEKFCSDRSPQLTELSCRYRDYAAWQRGRRRDDELNSQLDYWRERLKNAPLLDLPTDHPRPTAPSFAGAKVEFALSPALTTRLHALSRREGATLFMTLLAAFQLLLSRYTGQEDIVVGAPAADRPAKDFDGVVGLFVNTLALRLDLTGAPSFRQLLGRAREVCLGAYAHQAVPFELLVQELAPRRELNRPPLFQVMFVLQNTPVNPTRRVGLNLEPIEIDSAAAQFDLSLYLRERRGGLIGFVEYSIELFDRATIERMTSHFQSLLEGVVSDPEGSVATMPLLPAAERARLLVEGNDTAADFPRNSCIHELFEAQAIRTPTRVALEYAYDILTYRELNCRANRLARELRKLGIKPERLVAVMADRSMETVVALLAVLKAGGAYVPLDPAYPDQRLKFMLTDSRAAVLLTQEKYAGRMVEFSGNKIIIDDLLRGPGGNAANLKKHTSAENAVSVIYTSGSTGTPKGVVALHRGALNRCAWMWRCYPFGAGEKICQKTSLSFVDSVWEIFGALLQGVPTVIVPDAVAKDPELLLAHLSEHRVTRLVSVPSLLKRIIETCRDAPKQLRGLNYCFSSGEALSAELARRFRQALPACRLINLYGSSEVAGDVTYYEVNGEAVTPTIPIGRPIDNTQIHILDERMQPVPLGLRGEIYVGGENLARGYHDRAELTANRFSADPFSMRPGARLYRTGDLARYRADGNIEFLGRIDQQVKIRGCRVEVGEVEVALKQHVDVRDCVIAPAGGLLGEGDRALSDAALTAFVVPGQRRPAATELRAFLKKNLPDFMLPANFVFLDDLPLLPNGKIDRRGLTAWVPPNQDQAAVTAAEPRTELEALVAKLWESALRVDSIGVDDNFFERGGHSLLAAEVAARLRDILHRPVAVRDLFEAPTVAAFTARLEKMFQNGEGWELPPIESKSRCSEAPLSLSQEPLFLFSQLFGGGDFLNMPYAYRLSGLLDVPALRRALDEIINRHAALRTGFRETQKGPKQYIRQKVRLRLPLVDLTRHAEAQRAVELERISRQDAAQSFDVEEPPLVRVKLVRLTLDQHVLLVTLHHIITDQWSMGVFRGELAVLYEAFSKNQPSPLAQLRFQFADFARWQKKSLAQGQLEPQISYWKKQLDGLGPALDFHRGPRGKQPRYHSSRRPMDFDRELFERVQTSAREQNCTPFMIFVAALATLLHRYTGQKDIRIGTLTANRGVAGSEGMIGYFVNALVLRTRVEGKMTFAELIRDVRECCIAAYAHQELPFEYLESLLETKQKKSHAPLYQVMLNYRNQTRPIAEADGLTIASWNYNNRLSDPGIAISRLDVNFHLRELSTQLTGAVNYKTDLFDPARISKLLTDYSTILAQIAIYSGVRLADIALS